jgi:hypothetical protein
VKKHRIKPRRYSSEQVRGMLQNSVYFIEQLRHAAKERGFTGSSVTPIDTVISFLRKEK